MSLKNILGAALVVAMVASSAIAQPTGTVQLVRDGDNKPVLDASGDWQWEFVATPDGSLSNPGSVAIEVGVEATGAGLVGAAVDATNVIEGLLNPGTEITGYPTADGLNTSGDRLSAFLGSEPLSGPGNIFTFTTDGPSTANGGVSLTSTATWLGAYGGNGRIAQGGTNSDTLAGSASVTVTPGDANFDGNVNFQDASILSTNFNGNGIWTQGNFNGGDGSIDFGDASVLSTNFGAMGSAPGSGSAVPEPASIALMLIVSMLGLNRRSR